MATLHRIVNASILPAIRRKLPKLIKLIQLLKLIKLIQLLLPLPLRYPLPRSQANG